MTELIRRSRKRVEVGLKFAILGLKFAILGLKLTILATNLFCPELTLRLIGKPD